MSTEDLSVALERSIGWMRRAHPPGEWNAVALATLDSLARLGPQRVSDLTAQERITQPGMTGIVARFATAGFVTREPDPTDGRATLVTITEAGRAYVRDFHASRAATLAVHISALPPDARAALHAATDALLLLAGSPLEGALR